MSDDDQDVPFESLRGQVLTAIDVGDDEITFTAADGRVWKAFHRQNCCETVRVEDVCGDVQDIIGRPIEVAEERTSEQDPPADADSFTWTFYELRTVAGSVTIRWLGESNGYYSERVSLALISDESISQPPDR